MSIDEQRKHHILRAVIDLETEKKSHLNAMSRLLSHMTGVSYEQCIAEVTLLSEELIIERWDGLSHRQRTKRKLDECEQIKIKDR